MKINNLNLNVNKSCYMMIGRPHTLKKISNFNIGLDNTFLTRVSKMKILGITLDENLSWDDQVKKVKTTCNQKLSNLFPIRDIFSNKARMTFISAFILSVLNYGALIYFNTSKTNSCILLRLMKRAARFVFKKGYTESVTEIMYKKLRWLNPVNKLKFESLNLTYQIFHKLSPEFFYDYFNPDDFTQKNTRQRIVNVCNTFTTFNRSFQTNGMKLWLDLSDDLKAIPSFSIFKCKLFTMLHDKQLDDFNTQEVNLNDSIISDIFNDLSQ